MTKMFFDYRDLFRSTRIAFSFQRLWIQFVGLFCGYAVYFVLTYGTLILAGQSWPVVWSRFGLIPGISGQILPWYGWALYGLGLAALIYAWLVASLGVARASYMYLKGNTFYTWKEALHFAFRKKGGAVFATPVAIAAILFFVGLGGVLVGLAGDIPWGIGPVALSLFTVIWYAVSFFLVFIGLALCVSLLQTPAVLATTDDDAFEGVFQSFSLLASQPVRLILYEALLLVIVVIGTAILAFFAKQSWAVMTMLLKMGKGSDYIDISYAASGMLQDAIYPAWAWAKQLLGEHAYTFLFSHNFTSIDLSGASLISAHIMTVFMTLIGAYLLCYPFAIFNVGNTIIFLILKKNKDDENLLDRVDKEEEDEEEEDADADADIDIDDNVSDTKEDEKEK